MAAGVVFSVIDNPLQFDAGSKLEGYENFDL